MNNSPLTLAQIMGAIHRHRGKAFFVWLVVMCAVVAAYLVWPRQYSSEGRLYVKMDRNNASVNPSSSGTQVSIQDTRETEIRSVVEIIKSRAVLNNVVDEVGADQILENGIFDWMPGLSMPSFGRGGDSGEMSAEEYEHLKKRELAVKRLLRNMDVFAEKKTSVISVSVQSNSSQLAQEIVNRIFENTRRVHLQVHAVSRSADFFDEQFSEQEKELVAAVNELAEFRNKKRVHSIGAARDTLQGVLATLEQNTLTAEVNLEEVRERVAKLEELLKSTRAQIELPTTGVERLSYEDSSTELFKLKSERERLLATYNANHPKVKRIEAQLKALEPSLESMETERTESQLTTNPVYEAIEIDFVKAKAEMSAVLARLKGLKAKHQSTLAKLEELNKAEVTADQLQRNVDVARQYLAIYTQKRGESKAMEMLDDRNISDVVVAQEPTLMVKHNSPKGSLVLPLGFIAGLVAALAFTLYADRNHLSGPLNESEVEQVLDLPVLVTLPRVYSTRNMVN